MIDNGESDFSGRFAFCVTIHYIFTLGFNHLCYSADAREGDCYEAEKTDFGCITDRSYDNIVGLYAGHRFR